MDKYRSAALEQVNLERDRQEAKWGEQNHDPFTYLTVLGEEFGEGDYPRPTPNERSHAGVVSIGVLWAALAGLLIFGTIAPILPFVLNSRTVVVVANPGNRNEGMRAGLGLWNVLATESASMAVAKNIDVVAVSNHVCHMLRRIAKVPRRVRLDHYGPSDFHRFIWHEEARSVPYASVQGSLVGPKIIGLGDYPRPTPNGFVSVWLAVGLSVTLLGGTVVSRLMDVEKLRQGLLLAPLGVELSSPSRRMHVLTQGVPVFNKAVDVEAFAAVNDASIISIDDVWEKRSHAGDHLIWHQKQFAQVSRRTEHVRFVLKLLIGTIDPYLPSRGDHESGTVSRVLDTNGDNRGLSDFQFNAQPFNVDPRPFGGNAQGKRGSVEIPLHSGYNEQGYGHARNNNIRQSRGQFDPIGRRLIVFVGCWVAFGLCWWRACRAGSNGRRNLWAYGGISVLAAGYSLLFLTGFRWTWSWWL